MGFAGEMDVPGRDASPLELVHLGQEHLRVDDTTGADHARLPTKHSARDLPDLEGVSVDDDRVARVRPALVAADEVRILGEQVDDLALAFVNSPSPAEHGWSPVPESAQPSR